MTETIECPASEESSRAQVSHKYNKLFGFWGTDARRAFAGSGEGKKQPMRQSVAGVRKQGKNKRLRIPTVTNSDSQSKAKLLLWH